MWWALVQFTGRSQPGNRQPLSLTLSARRLGAEVTRVARPTSITIELASSTRDIVQSHARRSIVLLEMGGPNSRSDGGTPTSPFNASRVVVTVTCGRTPLRLGSVPWSIA